MAANMGTPPTHITDAVNRLTRTSGQMMHELGREPTADELAQRLDMSVERVQKLLDIAKTPVRFNS